MDPSLNDTAVADAPPESRKIMLAGAPWEITKNCAAGSFYAIPLTLWKAIIGFHRQVSFDHKAESFSYHRWYAKEGRYHSLIPFQETTKGGLSVRFDWESRQNKALLDQYGQKYQEDFFQGACTIHTHVDIAAFESGTDAADEERQPGWHITLGHLLTHERYDLDFRFRLPNVPMISRLTRADIPYKIEWSNLFVPGTSLNDVWREPGTKDWHHLLHRINLYQ